MSRLVHVNLLREEERRGHSPIRPRVMAPMFSTPLSSVAGKRCLPCMPEVMTTVYPSSFVSFIKRSRSDERCVNSFSDANVVPIMRMRTLLHQASSGALLSGNSTRSSRGFWGASHSCPCSGSGNSETVALKSTSGL